MKLEKQANGKTTVKMSKRDWLRMGRKAGWLRTAQPVPPQLPDAPYDNVGRDNVGQDNWTKRDLLTAEDLMAASEGNGWCSKSRHIADAYLNSGDLFTIYLRNGEPYAMARKGNDGNVKEFAGVDNLRPDYSYADVERMIAR